MDKLIKFNFNGEFIPELHTCRKSYTPSEVSTKYCTTVPAKLKTFNSDTYLIEALANYLGHINTMHLFVAKTTDNRYVCEYQRPGKDIEIAIAHENSDHEFTFTAGIMDDKGILKEYGEGHRGMIFTMLMTPYILTDPEAIGFIDELNTWDISDDNYGKAMCGLCNHYYYRLKDDKSESPVCYNRHVSKLTYEAFKDLDVKQVYCGSSKYTACSTKAADEDTETEEPEHKSCTASELKGIYALNPFRSFSKEEEARIPDLGEWYVVPRWAQGIAKRIQSSRKFRKGINNILLYGPSGSGKTEGAQAIAEMLNLPYYSHTCSPDDDKFDIVGQLVPNTHTHSGESSTDDMCKIKDLPSFDDVEYDYEASFEKLFGRKPDKFDSPADAYKELARRMLDKEQDDNDYIYVESELIQAIKHGGLCEIQEANIIKRTAVMEALNPLLATGDNAFIKLPTGEIVRRHPDCIIAFTINREYEGCCDIQQAVYSRLNYITHIPEPTVDELVSRTKAQTGFSDPVFLNKMAKTVYEIHEYCREKDISSGVCGSRELIDWAINVLLEAEDTKLPVSETTVIKAALNTVIEKAAQNEEDIEDVVMGVFCKNFSPVIVNKLRACA